MFDALIDPEGSLLLIDPNTAPYVHRYINVEWFLASRDPETRAVEIATITGVGSSALGSAALAWDISIALGKPVLAIVPGYGMAVPVLDCDVLWDEAKINRTRFAVFSCGRGVGNRRLCVAL